MTIMGRTVLDRTDVNNPGPSPAAAGGQRLDSREFRDVIGHFASGVTIISTARSEELFGTTASAVSSLSVDPPMVLICMNKSSSTGQAVSDAGAFAVNVLNEDQRELAERFATKATDKFAGTAHAIGPFGQPLLDGALAHLECQVIEEVTGGTHTVFLANVQTASAAAGTPLAYYRGTFGRLELAGDQQAYDELRRQILNGELAADEPLDLPEQATALAIPTGALYHVLGKLSTDGLLERRGPGAFVVPPITLGVVLDTLDARSTIELGVVARTVGRVACSRITELEHAVHLARPRAPGEDLGSSVVASGRFHETLVGLADSPALSRAYAGLSAPGVMARALAQAGYVIGPSDNLYADDHATIVAAYRGNDLVAAQAAVLEHAAHLRSAFEHELPAPA
jgi:flavin reductase (DIM6/NTAB) family NADH-FMN oxidoreductase RutF